MKSFLLVLSLYTSLAHAAPAPFVFGSDGKSINLQTGIALPQASTPAAPVTGRDYLYFKSDDHLYSKNHAGVETLIDSASSSGTVTSTSVVSANGFAGTVATATTTPAITLTTTITGLIKGAANAIVAAVSGTDYAPGTSGLATGILKSTTVTGGLTIATAPDFPTLNQNTSGSAASFTGSLLGDVTGTQGATVVSKIAGTTVSGTTGTGNSVFSAAPTFTGTLTAATVSASGNVTGANLSGTNTGDLTLVAFGSTPATEGASLSGQALTLQPADATHGGGVSTTTQTMAGAKTFSTSVLSPIHSTTTANPSTTGIIRLANAELIGWRNAANGADLTLGLSAGNTFAFTSAVSSTGNIGGSTLSGTSITGTTYLTASANGASAGNFRLANTNTINWRNAANSANLGITLDSSNIFQLGSNLTVAGGYAAALTTQSGTSYSITATDSTVLLSGTSGTITATLPTAVGITGRMYTIKRTGTGATSYTANTTSSQTIDGSTTYTLAAQYDFITVQSDNANWHIISK